MRILFIAPRLLGILTILFISLFALDVFGLDLTWPQALLAFAIHLIPSFVLTLIFIVAWRYERIGGILLMIAGLLPFVLLRGSLLGDLIIGGPVFVTGALFVINYWQKSQPQ